MNPKFRLTGENRARNLGDPEGVRNTQLSFTEVPDPDTTVPTMYSSSITLSLTAEQASQYTFGEVYELPNLVPVE